VVERGLLLPLVPTSLRLGVADVKGALDNLLKGAATQCMQVSIWSVRWDVPDDLEPQLGTWLR
jgi:N-acetyl-gamma-glutamylphosphate reductase